MIVIDQAQISGFIVTIKIQKTLCV